MRYYRYLIIGNSAGGVGAMEAIRGIDRDGSMAVISDEVHHTYGRPMISYYLANEVDFDKIFYRPSDFYEKNNIDALLGRKAARINFDQRSAVLDDGEEIEFEVDYYRHDPEKTETRKMVLTREVYIERSDFMVVPPKKFFRLSPENEVRLMNACLVTCTGYDLDEEDRVKEIRVTYDPDSLGGQAPDGRRVKGTLHWVSAAKALVSCVGHWKLDPNPFQVNYH